MDKVKLNKSLTAVLYVSIAVELSFATHTMTIKVTPQKI